MPTGSCRRMLPVFDPILKQMSNRDFSKEQIHQVMELTDIPSHRDSLRTCKESWALAHPTLLLENI